MKKFNINNRADAWKSDVNLLIVRVLRCFPAIVHVELLNSHVELLHVPRQNFMLHKTAMYWFVFLKSAKYMYIKHYYILSAPKHRKRLVYESCSVRRTCLRVSGIMGMIWFSTPQFGSRSSFAIVFSWKSICQVRFLVFWFNIPPNFLWSFESGLYVFFLDLPTRQ